MPAPSEIQLLFLGTGTSAGVPMIGCKCEVCTSADPRDRRTRPSVVISYNNLNILVDTSPELRLQAIANDLQHVDAIVFTHAHADHIMGLDDVRRYNAIKGGALDVWADPRTHDTLSNCFDYAFREPDPQANVFRPHLARRYIHGPFFIGDVKWTPIPLYHGQLPILGFRIGNLAYCTDVSTIPPESLDLLRGLNLLVLDGLQFKKHPTHFSIEEAIAAARMIDVPRTYLTHIAHGVMHERDSAKLPPGIHFAYDGLRVSTSA